MKTVDAALSEATKAAHEALFSVPPPLRLAEAERRALAHLRVIADYVGDAGASETAYRLADQLAIQS